eukprot:scaffold4565_cov53-Cyclotella_meneghiniana.AAC.15
MEALRDEQINSAQLQSRVEQLERENAELQRECEILRQANSTILQRQLDGEAEISKLKEENKLLQTSCDFANKAAKYREIVKANSFWGYPVDAPSDDYLFSLGFDEEESEQIVDGINNIANLTTRMRRGERIQTLEPAEYFWEEYGVYIPHYKEFALALVEYQHTINYFENDVFTFLMGYKPLQREVLDFLESALKQTHFNHMAFHQNDIEGVGYIDFIAKCVRANTRLSVCILRDVNFEYSNDMDALCGALNNKLNLRELVLDKCETEVVDLNEVFAKLKSKSLEEIELSGNRLSDLGPNDMSELLLSNPSLRTLGLQHNSFNEQDIVYISDAIRHSTTLRKLDLGRNADPFDWYLLVAVVFDRTSLNAAFDSNHYCHVNIPGILWFNTCEEPIWNRRKKIYSILSTRNNHRQNAAYFESDEIGIKHIPQILSLLKPFSEYCIHDKDGFPESDEVLPLSIAYEIMRDWKMPELYNMDTMD